MKTSSAKAKGRRLTQRVKELLLKHSPALSEDDILVVPSNVSGEDLILSPKAREIFPVTIECKNQEKLNIWSAIDQAEKRRTEFLPVVVFSRNRSKTYIVAEIEKTLNLLFPLQCESLSLTDSSQSDLDDSQSIPSHEQS